jgi:hypothetical protein
MDHKSKKAMRLPRVTIRRLLLLVAAMALVLGILVALQRRSERFRGRAAEYASAIHTVYFADVNGKEGRRERCEIEAQGSSCGLPKCGT